MLYACIAFTVNFIISTERRNNCLKVKICLENWAWITLLVKTFICSTSCHVIELLGLLYVRTLSYYLDEIIRYASHALIRSWSMVSRAHDLTMLIHFIRVQRTRLREEQIDLSEPSKKCVYDDDDAWIYKSRSF
jgi:hypothetical protein